MTIVAIGFKKSGENLVMYDVLLTRYDDIVYGFPATGLKYLEYISSLRIMHNNNNSRA